MIEKSSSSMGVFGSKRLGGAAMVIGAVLVLVGNMLHPEWSEANYASVTAGAMWLPIHASLISGFIVQGLGFVNLFGVLRGRNETVYSLAALYSIMLGTGIFVVQLVLDGFAGPILGANYLVATGGSRETLGVILEYNHILSDNLIVPAFLLTWASFGLFGTSMRRAKIYHKELAIVGLIIGLWGVGAGLFGTYFVHSPLFSLLVAITSIWIIAVGIVLLRY